MGLGRVYRSKVYRSSRWRQWYLLARYSEPKIFNGEHDSFILFGLGAVVVIGVLFIVLPLVF